MVKRGQSQAGGPSGDAEPQAEQGQHLQDRISFNRNQKPEGICRSQEGGVCQVNAEQSHQVTYSLHRKLPPWVGNRPRDLSSVPPPRRLGPGGVH